MAIQGQPTVQAQSRAVWDAVIIILAAIIVALVATWVATSLTGVPAGGTAEEQRSLIEFRAAERPALSDPLLAPALIEFRASEKTLVP